MNRLKDEKSPYLLQHAANPADCSILIARHADPAGGGFFLASIEGEDGAAIHHKPIADGALPSANSAALLALVKLGRIMESSRYLEEAGRIARLIPSRMLEEALA